MAWKTEAPKVATEPRTKESLWESHYPDSLETWKKDFALAGYKLTAEYDLGDNRTLYRFEGPGVPHNVVIRTEIKNVPTPPPLS